MPKGKRSKPYLAFDLGAESGRAVLGELRHGILTTQEIHRFKNQSIEEAGSLRWNARCLWAELRKVLAERRDTELAGIGVDTWGVDYALLGKNGELLENPYHYRDSRTVGMMEKVFRIVPQEEIYRITGIQFMPINTLYQLYAAKKRTPSVLAAAEKLLTMPDLFHYWLSGNAVCEYTNATTTQLVDAANRKWAHELLERLEIPTHIFVDIVEPGTEVGELSPQLAQDTGLARTPVIAPATHDTGSAVAAITARDGVAFLSSGTWSLLGTEIDSPITSPEALRLNFTNEGGVNGTTRLLKNVMGLWMVRSCIEAWSSSGRSIGLSGLLDLAAEESAFQSFVDPDHESFLHPANMPAAIDQFCELTHQATPKSPQAYLRVILESLALKYRVVLTHLERLISRPIEKIRVIGGGSKNHILNQWTADATGKTVIAGPAEATALGNIAVQLVATKVVDSLAAARAIVDRSFPTETFEPRDTDKWERHAERFEQYCRVVYA